VSGADCFAALYRIDPERITFGAKIASWPGDGNVDPLVFGKPLIWPKEPVRDREKTYPIAVAGYASRARNLDPTMRRNRVGSYSDQNSLGAPAIRHDRLRR